MTIKDILELAALFLVMGGMLVVAGAFLGIGSK